MLIVFAQRTLIWDAMTDRFNTELGRKIRAAREARARTQEDLGVAVKLSRTSITNIELGRQRLLVDQLAGISAELGISIDELVPSAEFLKPTPRSNGEAVGPDMPTVKSYIDKVKAAEPQR